MSQADDGRMHAFHDTAERAGVPGRWSGPRWPAFVVGIALISTLAWIGLLCGAILHLLQIVRS